MKSELSISLEELNNSYNNRMVTIQGIVKELSYEYKDENYGFIQLLQIQILKKNKQQIGVHRDVNVILLENYIRLKNLGDKVQITGIQEIYNACDSRRRDLVIIAKKIEIVNDEVYNNLTQQDITKIRTIATFPLVQQHLANFIFDKIPLDDDIKLVGTLILFSTDSSILVNQGIHSKISLLIVGASGTYKTPFLQKLKNLSPNDNFQYSQKSDVRFIAYDSRYKRGGKYCKRAGLADFAKNGIVLIDNLEELKKHKLMQLRNNFIEILRKSSLISAAHPKNRNYSTNISVYDNLQFPYKDSLLEKFDIILVTNNKPDEKIVGKNTTQEMIKHQKEIGSLLSKDLLRKYIFYAKKGYDPIVSKEAGNQITKFKEEILRVNKKKEFTKKINELDLVRTIIILSKAYARIALKNKISLEDVKKIISIYKKSLSNQDFIRLQA